MKVTIIKILFTFWVLLTVIIVNSSGFSQNSIGTALSNYTPTNAVVLNPANMANAKTWLDINVVGFGSYTNNNDVFISNNNLISLIRGKYSADVYYDRRRMPIRLYNHDFVAGPGATWNKGDNAIGLSINGRSYTGLQELPASFRPLIENGVKDNFQFNKDFDGKNIRIATLNFAEIKASYSRTFYKMDKNLFTAGISLKKFYSIA